jgi:broad specificity phosphatase PhoE
MTTILLIRHGENDSLSKYLPGHLPGIHLNEAGKAQAQLVAESLKDVPITSFISSPLERAIETAEPLARILGLPINLDPGFIEMGTGSWTGKNFPDVKADPLWEKLRSDPEKYGFPDGESFGAAQERLWRALQQTIENQPEHAIVAIFSHSDCIKLLLTRAMDSPLKRYYSFSVDTASLNVLIFRKNRIYLDGQNLRLPYQWKPRVKITAINNQISS